GRVEHLLDDLHGLDREGLRGRGRPRSRRPGVRRRRRVLTASHEERRCEEQNCARLRGAHATSAGRSSGASDDDTTTPFLPTMTYTANRTNTVATIAKTRPPTTARPSNTDWSPPSPTPSAMDIMPTTIAKLVIRIGRTRLRT